jgi:protein TonB
MSTLPFATPMTIQRSFAIHPENQPQRWVVVAWVMLLHASFGGVWIMSPAESTPSVKEMTVSMVLPPPTALQPEVPPPKPQVKIERTEQPVSKPVVREMADVAPKVMPLAAPPVAAVAPAPAPTVSAPTVADTEPDYKAGYLHNARPAYPMVARKMGWEGKVILNVEVLAEGACGAISVFSSSGRDVLDNAAIHAVKGWHFSPARHGGQTVTKWFKVPINFSLEDSEV